MVTWDHLLGKSFLAAKKKIKWIQLTKIIAITAPVNFVLY